MTRRAFSLDGYQAGSYRCVQSLKDPTWCTQNVQSPRLINLANHSFVEILPINVFDRNP